MTGQVPGGRQGFRSLALQNAENAEDAEILIM